MSHSPIQHYYLNTIDALKALQTCYHFEKKYALEEEIIAVELSYRDPESHVVKNISLEELIFGVISGMNCPRDVSFNLYHVQVSTVYSREEKSVARGRVLHALSHNNPQHIFNMSTDEMDVENNYKWNYMGEDNVLHSCVDLAYLLVTFWPSGDLFKETAPFIRNIVDALDSWCPEFTAYKETLLTVAFK